MMKAITKNSCNSGMCQLGAAMAFSKAIAANSSALSARAEMNWATSRAIMPRENSWFTGAEAD